MTDLKGSGLNEETLELGDYFASILHCGDLDEPWYYVVQRSGTSTVLDMERYPTEKEARDAALEALEELQVSDADRGYVRWMK